MARRPVVHLTDAVVTDQRTRRGILRLAAGAGAGVPGLLSAVDALGKKKHKKKKCKKQAVSLRTDLVTCPGPEDHGLSGSKRYAQTFTAGRTGVLTAAQVELLFTFAEMNFNIAIRAVDGNGVPTDEVLAQANVGDVPDNTDTPVTYGVLFDPPASVVAGEQYAVAVTETASDISFSVTVRDNNVCNGEMFGDTNATDNFDPVQGSDMIFAVSITSAS